MQVSNIPSILFIAACLTLQVYAAETVSQDQPADEVPAQQEQEMEEITVIGQKLISTLRQQIYRAEDNAFEIFNTLNDDDEYDVHCEMVARTGTLIRKRMCLPNFYHRATADNSAELLGLITNYSNNSIPSQTAKNVLAYKFPIFKDKVKVLAKKNPELLGAMQDLFELTEELKNTRDIYHGIEDD